MNHAPAKRFHRDGVGRVHSACIESLEERRLLSAFGALDTSFGTGGIVTGYGGPVKVQADGKIVLAGQTLSVGTSYDFALARFNANGSDDVTFGVGGTEGASVARTGRGAPLPRASCTCARSRTAPSCGSSRGALARSR